MRTVNRDALHAAMAAALAMLYAIAEPRADRPTKYSCGRGEPKGSRCRCPAGEEFLLTPDNIATCVPKEPSAGGRRSARAKDIDGDGLVDKVDRCPRDAEDRDGFRDDDGCPEPDNDLDDVPDARDGCPTDAEDRDAFEDADGCPDLDNDRDGTTDAVDGCPMEAEDRDGVSDADGCPDLDDDRDGVPDAADKCRDAPEDRDGFRDDDGCPDPDDDADGVLDASDLCPRTAEDIDNDNDTDGCPEEAPLRPPAKVAPRNTRRSVALGLGIGAVVSASTALGLELWGRNVYADYEDMHDSAGAGSLFQKADRLHLGAQAALGAGGLLGAASVYLYLTSGSGPQRKPPLEATLTLTHGLGFAITGRM